MSDKTTAITVTYLFPDGRRLPLGTGRIGALGRIEITAPAPDQETYIAEAMAELNARENVILKEPPEADMPQIALVKRKVPRGDPGFLTALKDYGRRVYGMEFAFDEAAISPHPAERLTASGLAVPAAASGAAGRDDPDAPRRLSDPPAPPPAEIPKN